MQDKQDAVYQRLNFIVERLENGSQADFARRLGVRSGVIGDMFGKRRNKPSFDVLSKMVLAYPQLRVEWLLTGEGDMLKQSTASQSRGHAIDPSVFATKDLDHITHQIIATQTEQGRAAALLYQEPKESIEAQSNYFVVVGELHLVNSEIATAVHKRRPKSEVSRLQEKKAHIESRVAVAEMQWKTYSIKNELTVREARAAVYCLDGIPDTTKPFGGLLHYRLGVAIELSTALVKNSKIRSVERGNIGICVTEQAVREFLGET